MACYINHDNQIITTAEHEVMVWDALTGELQHRFSPTHPTVSASELIPGISDNICAVIYIPDKQQIVASYFNGAICVWSLYNSQIVKEERVHQGRTEVTLSPDEKIYASWAYGGQLYLWNAATHKRICELKGHTGDVYDAIVEDLKTAISFMEQVPSRGDKSYVSQNAAKALLSRVYLYMGDEHLQECLDLCNDLMANAPSVVTEGYDFADYPTHTYNHDETIWCLRLDENHDFAKADHAEASIASMYLEDGQGWGEHYWSDILIDLFQRYPEDQRFAAYFRMNGLTNDGKMMVTFPYKTKASNNYCSSYVVHGLRPDTDGAYSFQFNNVTYKAVPTEVNTYTQYIVTGIDFVTGETGASKTSRVFVRPDVNNTKGVRENGGDYVIYYNTKFSYQDGKPMMTSPVFLRWGEVVLNRAEANAKLGNDQPALVDVNTIRLRAGLPETAKMTVDNYEERGYDSILDVVLDERRMELCFEGHRAFDVYRNKKKLDRRFVGFHSFEEIDYTDKRIALLIPADEINTSHIDQNPR